jgi:hypothetical protein
MKWFRPADPVARVERTAWALLGGTTIVLLLLSIASSANFTSIIMAQESVYVVPSFRVAFTGINSSGSLGADGSVTVNADFNIVNPSDRSLHATQVTYCGWIEDLPAETGVNTSRIALDVMVGQGASSRYFLRLICPPPSMPRNPIPARGNASVVVAYSMDRQSDPQRFAALQNITDYAAHVLGNVAAAPWNHWALVFLSIDGVPPVTSPTAGSYILKIHIIARQVGTYLV